METYGFCILSIIYFFFIQQILKRHLKVRTFQIKFVFAHFLTLQIEDIHII